MRRVFTFGFLKIRKLNSKTVYRVSDRNLKLTFVNFLSQHLFGFIPTTQNQIRI